MTSIRLLCVDDERNVLRALQRVFRSARFQLTTALSGPEALTLLEKGPVPEVVLADYRMPGMNGVELLHQVHERWPETIRIILSGYAEATAVEEALREGKVFRFFAKPWDDQELIAAIEQAVDHPVCRLDWRRGRAGVPPPLP